MCVRFVLFLIAVNSCVLGFPFVEELYEGSSCPLEDGGIGICKRLPECPSRLLEVREGRRTSESSGRCGFDSFTEIVCCPLNITDKIGLRPAEIACRENENEIDNDDFNPNDVSFHIIGGEEAREGEFPYMVALGYENREIDEENPGPIKYLCGGTLISSQHVLTAAHCVSNIDGMVPKLVKLGNTDLTAATSDAQTIEVIDAVKHPRYKRSVTYNDVAILKLKTSALMTNSVKPICLYTKPLTNIHPRANITFLVLGWGATSFDTLSSSKLKKTRGLSIIDTTTCGKAYKDFARLPRGIDDTMLCAMDANPTNRSDGCHGDSGGPLLLISQAGHSVVGITAFGQGCAGPVPGVYISIYPFLDWIEQQVWPETRIEQEIRPEYFFEDQRPGKFIGRLPIR